MFTQQLINGLALGSVYALIALGYTMVYGILQLINFAHGEVYMLGSYLGVIVFGVLTSGPVTARLSWFGAAGDPQYVIAALGVTILVSMLFCAVYGAVI